MSSRSSITSKCIVEHPDFMKMAYVTPCFDGPIATLRNQEHIDGGIMYPPI